MQKFRWSTNSRENGKGSTKMKNNKTPGIDGFPAEFLKVFWGSLKFFVLRALNRCYEKGLLSISLCQAVINCNPKGDKTQEFLKNWRPISLLSTLYKLASATIAERLNLR